MNVRNFLTGAAVAAVLAASGSANAQLLGGGATGGLSGSIAGGLGNVGATAGGGLNGSLRGSTDALGRVRDTGSRVTEQAAIAATAARGQVDAAIADADAAASGAQDVAADGTAVASAGASATGEAGSTLETADEAVVEDQKPAKPRRARREARRNAEPVDSATQPAKPQPKAEAGGNARAEGGLGVTRDGQASGQADTSFDANASIEK